MLSTHPTSTAGDESLVTKKASSLGILVGVVLIAIVALGGSDGSWDRFTLPPVVIGAAAALLLQWIGFVFAWKFQSERFFDLIGSATFGMVVLVSTVCSRANLGLLDVFLAAAVAVWAFRLGSFLVTRVRLVGSDVRFDAIKRDFLWFLMTWTLQGTWVVVTAGPVMTLVGDGISQPIGILETLGIIAWVIGLGLEIVADEQKKKFRQAGNDSFIQSGLWSRSRHPNYFGEILLWSGLAMAAVPSLSGWQIVTSVSPLFVWALLMKISGAPMLEAKADRRWGNDPAYLEYKSKTPLLVPRLR